VATVFPNFTTFPRGLRTFSYQDITFAPYTFGLADTSTPWLFFDDRARSFILSPASNFMVAKMVGDGKSAIGASLNQRLGKVPKGLRQDSLLVFGQGIGRTWDRWGETLREFYRRPAATPASDVIVRTFGYWTDNGADYYYDYDPEKGYTGTLLALRDHYRKQGIPLGYLQLDSWWYRKLTDSISGEANPGRKTTKFPESEWNRYGGILEYRASTDLFPNGLNTFSREFGLPFAVHSRWIDRESPYRTQFRISGAAPVDPRYWRQVADYLAASGVTCFEQDWLDNIYHHSPEMASTVGVADAFTDGMANAMRRKGITLQYCMPTPRFVLQGLKYPNLTTVRPSADRIEPGKWAQFLFGSQLAAGVGAYPWTDVFRSRETGNMILAVLSAGPVGTGDAIGVEDKANILRAARPDGEIVKPDRSILPTDATYFNEAARNGKPFVATTYTRHGGQRTSYFFAFPRDKAGRDFELRLAEQEMRGRAYLLDLGTGGGRFVDAADRVSLAVGEESYSHLMAVPISRTGVALLGDLGKIVPTGKQRIAAVEETARGLRVRASFAKSEGPVTIEGVSEKEPKVRARRGTVRLLGYDARTRRFRCSVTPDRAQAEFEIDGQG
jgi:hypothetical protein